MVFFQFSVEFCIYAFAHSSATHLSLLYGTLMTSVGTLHFYPAYHALVAVSPYWFCRGKEGHLVSLKLILSVSHCARYVSFHVDLHIILFLK